MLVLVTSRIGLKTGGQTGLRWLYADDVGPWMVVAVMTVVAVVTEVLNPDDVVPTMMGMTVQLLQLPVRAVVAVVAVLVESGLMAMVTRWHLRPLWRRRHWNHSWVKSLKRLVRRRHESLWMFHFMRSSLVPSLLLCEPSSVWHPLVGVPSVTSDEVETLVTRLIPGSRASLFDFDAAG